MGLPTFEFKRGTAERWTLLNLILAAGEPGLEKDTGKFKIGDGRTPWRNLPYFGNVGLLDEHINDPTPHPAYDDGPSLLLLYENAKV